MHRKRSHRWVGARTRHHNRIGSKGARHQRDKALSCHARSRRLRHHHDLHAIRRKVQSPAPCNAATIACANATAPIMVMRAPATKRQALLPGDLSDSPASRDPPISNRESIHDSITKPNSSCHVRTFSHNMFMGLPSSFIDGVSFPRRLTARVPALAMELQIPLRISRQGCLRESDQGCRSSAAAFGVGGNS